MTKSEPLGAWKPKLDRSLRLAVLGLLVLATARDLTGMFGWVAGSLLVGYATRGVIEHARIPRDWR